MAGPLTTGLLDPSAHQGLHGESLVRALVAAVGLEISRPEPAYGKDYYVGFPGPRETLRTPKILVSVKSWSTPTLGPDNCWHYPLRGSNYNFLARSTDLRPYLFLVTLPALPADYSEATHDQLVLRTAAYWYSFEGIAFDPGLEEASTRTVLVPRVNLLNASTLLALVEGRETDAVVAT
jgi:hypothetical protein